MVSAVGGDWKTQNIPTVKAWGLIYQSLTVSEIQHH